ncbi:hypothetical protein ABIE26_000826 [Pedobacter africanus]|uniref:Uncharacterized protein n=1 Tax=Pedobacter africanus TaxID=151894 RepID=A0ACC6KU27_9SPHI|nr:DUF1493 family protein [Pedobacter africanus]MDR6782687.1 hypothetical protein [Pedobacter africanus]
MKYTLEDIINFLKDQSLEDEISPETNVCDEIGMRGDDFHEMMTAYAEKFSVDMTGYLWYFHSEEEGSWTSISLFPRANEQVKRIPLTPTMLTDFANSGKWNVVYPEHKITLTEYNSYFTLFILIVLIGLIIYQFI